MHLRSPSVLTILFFVLVANTSIAQVRATQEVAFDLDKRSIGTLPFDERFKLTAFDTKYDVINFTYSISSAFLGKKPNYFSGGSMPLTIDKSTGKAIFPQIIGPLHPNVVYDFKFEVSKQIALDEDKEEALRKDIFDRINKYFKDVKATDGSAITAFKADLQQLLFNYAGTNQIVDATGNIIDVRTTPLFSSDIQPTLSALEQDYFKLNTDYKKGDPTNQVTVASNNTITALSNDKMLKVFQKLSWILNKESRSSKLFKALLNAPINPVPGANEKLTLKQYLSFIIEDPIAELSPVINGTAKIVGNTHPDASALDLESIKLLKVVFEKLTRNSVKDWRGRPIFSTDEINNGIRYLITRLDLIINKQSDYLLRTQRIKTAPERIPNLLKNAIAKKDITISEQVNIDVMAEKNAYIGLDAGVGFAFGSANGLFTYQGANFYFRPVNHRTPFSELEGTDEFYKRFSVYLGIAQIITDEEDRYEGLLGESSVLVGAGFRLNRGFRLNVGGLIHYLNDRNPIVDNKKITVSPTVSLSIDINLVKALGAVGGALNLQ